MKTTNCSRWLVGGEWTRLPSVSGSVQAGAVAPLGSPSRSRARPPDKRYTWLTASIASTAANNNTAAVTTNIKPQAMALDSQRGMIKEGATRHSAICSVTREPAASAPLWL